jgi:glycosyltransferase involved in cell wall biosynthesis
MRTLFFTKFPPPHTGQTVGTEIFAGMVEGAGEVGRIDTSFGTIKPNRIGVDWTAYQIRFSAQVLRNLLRLYEALRTGSYDQLYFVASPSLMGHVRDLLTVAIARPYVDRIVAHVHNGNFRLTFEEGLTRYSSPFLARTVDTFVFSSHRLSDQLSDHLSSCQRTVVRNTVDEEVRCSETEVVLKIKQKMSRDTFRVLFLSNMIPSKGYWDLARAAKRLVQKGLSSLHVDFVGDWPDESRRHDFEAYLDRNHLEDRVRIHGRVTDRITVRQFLLDADVFVLPTYYPNEAQPFSIIEAMNAGTPIVATSHASIPEYVIHDRNGYLVSKKAPSEIAEAIRLLTRFENWGEKARAAREVYEDGFSPASVRHQLFDALALNSNPQDARAV